MFTKRMIEKYLGIGKPSRRDFLKGTGAAAGALVIATTADFGDKAALAAPGPDAPQPNVFIRIAPDNTVTVLDKHLDMGQGNATGLTTIVAEELDADWSQMRSEFAPANAALYKNLAFGVQGTGGSTAIANSWMQLRRAGAAARAMLVAAAAREWKVKPSEISVSKGVISHKRSGRHGTFGQFAAKAAALPVPTDVKLKDPKQFTLIGKRIPRIDSVIKTTGRAVYAMDIRRPGQVAAVLARPDRFGATVKSYDAAEAKQIPGVIEVVQVPQGIAVIAKDTWSAMQGRKALKVEWDDAQAESRSTSEIFAEYRKLAAEGPGASAAKRGDVDAALKGAARVVEAEFEFPFLAHAPMEPLNGVIELTPDGAEIWAGSQFQTIEQAVAAQTLGLKPEQVKINTLWAGGSFGRRATPNADYFGEMAAIAKASSVKAPIHLVWTREDDIKGGRYRPMFYHHVRAGIDAQGNIVAWQHKAVGQSFMFDSPFAAVMIKDGVDETAVEGAKDMPYAIPNFSMDWYQAKSPVTTLWWRSVGHTHTAQVVEVMIDALAHEAGKNPYEFRLAMLKNSHPRHVGVLKLAAEKGKFGERLPKGKGRGIAVHESFNSYVAMVSDISLKPGGGFKVDKIVAAVDCGVPVNPDVIRAQVEGGAGFGLGAAMRNKITLSNGVVEQANFNGYEPIRMSDMPEVEVHIVNSPEAPSGIGEPGVPPVAPSVTNAIFDATGKRLFSLPWNLDALQGS